MSSLSSPTSPPIPNTSTGPVASVVGSAPTSHARPPVTAASPAQTSLDMVPPSAISPPSFSTSYPIEKMPILVKGQVQGQLPPWEGGRAESVSHGSKIIVAATRTALPDNAESLTSLSSPPSPMAQMHSSYASSGISTPTDEFITSVIIGSPDFRANFAAKGNGKHAGGAQAKHRRPESIPVTESSTRRTSYDGSVGTPPIAIPIIPAGPSRRGSASSVNISPANSAPPLHRHRSETHISKSHNDPRTLRSSRHTRSMSFGNSDEDDDYEDEEDGSVGKIEGGTCRRRSRNPWRDWRDTPPSLPLVPYKNQVGGHASFLRFSDKAICKPLNGREKEFYETVETTHPEIQPFMATYLGVVNVTYSTASAESSALGVVEGLPVVILDENKHILLDDDEDDHLHGLPSPYSPKVDKTNSGGGSEDSVNSLPSCSRRLQQQIFKDALSPLSLRARFAQLKNVTGVLGRRHSTGDASEAISSGVSSAGADRLNYESQEAESLETEASVPRVSVENMTNGEVTPTRASAKSGTAKNALLYPPGPERGPADSLSPIFQMSDDEEDPARDSNPRQELPSTPTRTSPSTLPPHMQPNHPHRMTRSPSTPSPVRPSVLAGADVKSSTPEKEAPTMPTPPIRAVTANGYPGFHDNHTTSFNPWSLQLYNNAMAKWSEESACASGKGRTSQFLLLEDLTQGLRSPCILDLKMGSRQHGVFATSEKRASQERKCEKSTSKKLGVRICGMQVYKVNTGTFTYLDKYVGRQISPATFKQSLLSFLDNGEQYLIGYIPKMLEKLRELHRVVSKMPTFRFYASSLLILYDGAWALEERADSGNIGGGMSVGVGMSESVSSEKQVDMKMIDFANCVSNTGALRRMDEPEPSPFLTTDDKSRTVAVPCPPTTIGPDNGYLLGLRTLIKSFEDLYRELCGGGGVSLTPGGHVWKHSLSNTQKVAVGAGFPFPSNFSGGDSTDLLSPAPLLLAGSAPTGTGNSMGNLMAGPSGADRRSDGAGNNTAAAGSGTASTPGYVVMRYSKETGYVRTEDGTPTAGAAPAGSGTANPAASRVNGSASLALTTLPTTSPVIKVEIAPFRRDSTTTAASSSASTLPSPAVSTTSLSRPPQPSHTIPTPPPRPLDG
ncbi:hypothetical protein DFS34DRAFT_651092 [Phlyctochytrium arcticum]|nr:hypothetical protein DFS34DRAFT_651092 [Phlyctochytrium arcticum]